MIDPDSQTLERLELAQQIAREAGDLTLETFRTDPLAVEKKGDGSPVTEADRGAEQLLRRRIEQAYPDDRIVGEEFPEKAGTSDYQWILDPIDGTRSFVAGVPLYGTLIGVTLRDEATIGIIHIPALRETISAAVGHGAWYRRADEPPQRASVSSCARLSDGLFCTSEVDTFHEVDRFDAFHRLYESAGVTRTWGDCYGYLLVATGRAAVMVDAKLNVWDAAALKPVLDEAGGTFTDWQGIPTIRSGNAVATNGHVTDEVMAILRDKGRATS